MACLKGLRDKFGYSKNYQKHTKDGLNGYHHCEMCKHTDSTFEEEPCKTCWFGVKYSDCRWEPKEGGEIDDCDTLTNGSGGDNSNP